MAGAGNTTVSNAIANGTTLTSSSSGASKASERSSISTIRMSGSGGGLDRRIRTARSKDVFFTPGAAQSQYRGAYFFLRVLQGGDITVSRIDGETGRLRYANAGQVAPMLLRAATGEIERLTQGGPPVGLLTFSMYEDGEVTLQPGDTVLCYSDGISEATKLLVIRGSQTVGKLSIVAVQGERTVANIIPDTLAAGMSIAPGDRVILEKLYQ